MGGENSIEVGEKAVTSFSNIYAYKAWCLQFEKTKKSSFAIFQAFLNMQYQRNALLAQTSGPSSCFVSRNSSTKRYVGTVLRVENILQSTPCTLPIYASVVLAMLLKSNCNKELSLKVYLASIWLSQDDFIMHL